MINLYFIASYIQHSGDYLGENPQYVYFNGSLVSLAGATVLFTILFGILTIFTSNFISKFLHQSLLNKIIKMYPKDIIVYKFCPSSISVSLIEFFIGGGFIGGYIIPIFIFDEITHIDTVTKSNLIFFVFIAAGILFAWLLFKSYILVLTNKRIIGLSYGGFVKDIIMLFDDIKTIQKSFGGWEVIFKDGTSLPLKCHPKAKNFYEKLKQLKNKEEINEQR